MSSGVSGRKIAVVAADGVDERELVELWRALVDAGADPHLISVRSGEVQAVRGDGPGDRFPVDRVVTDVRAGEYDGLVLPGGPPSVDRLRTQANVVSFVRAFMDADKPVAAISDGQGLLVEADEVRGRTLASSPTLRDVIREAGGEWVDQPVATDQKLVTARGVDALPAFAARMLALFERAIDERRLDFMVEQSFPASDPLPGPRSGAESERGPERTAPPDAPRA